ncbi:MAG: glutaredoxin family protein [Myxococcales bacterium]|nr:glutaredoxin family protein [Myxococcales bacterium]
MIDVDGRRPGGALMFVAALVQAIACGDETERTAPESSGATEPLAATATDRAIPPFSVRGDLTGLFVVWFDADGPHTAASREEIPVAARQYVRVDSLTLPPDQRLDPDHVYVADVRSAQADGTYPVTVMTREALEARMTQLRGPGGTRSPSDPDSMDPDAISPDALDSDLPQGSSPSRAPSPVDIVAESVVLYRTSWCGACKAAARFLRGRGVAFVEKDIERDPEARRELQGKLSAAGMRGGGVPVIDFRGTLVQGFDQGALERLMRATTI